jgi:hypothetical protein
MEKVKIFASKNLETLEKRVANYEHLKTLWDMSLICKLEMNGIDRQEFEKMVSSPLRYFIDKARINVKSLRKELKNESR